MKYLKLLVCSIALSTLTGCLYQSVTPWDFERAATVCGGSDKVIEIHSYFAGSEFVVCKDKTLDNFY